MDGLSLVRKEEIMKNLLLLSAIGLPILTQKQKGSCGTKKEIASIKKLLKVKDNEDMNEHGIFLFESMGYSEDIQKQIIASFIGMNKTTGKPVGAERYIERYYPPYSQIWLKAQAQRFDLVDIHDLDYRQIGLSSIPDCFQYFSDNLTYVNFSFNELTELPPSFSTIEANNISLYGNKLTELPEDFGSIGTKNEMITLGLTGNQLKTIPESFGDIKNLQILHLANNHLKSLPETFGPFPFLKELRLDNNQLQSIPDALFASNRLEELNFDNNKILSLPNHVHYPVPLTMLRLGNNKLTTLPTKIGRLPWLQNLSLRDNPIQSLPPFSNKKRLHIMLHRTPLDNDVSFHKIVADNFFKELQLRGVKRRLRS